MIIFIFKNKLHIECEMCVLVWYRRYKNVKDPFESMNTIVYSLKRAQLKYFKRLASNCLLLQRFDIVTPKSIVCGEMYKYHISISHRIYLSHFYNHVRNGYRWSSDRDERLSTKTALVGLMIELIEWQTIDRIWTKVIDGPVTETIHCIWLKVIDGLVIVSIHCIWLKVIDSLVIVSIDYIWLKVLDRLVIVSIDCIWLKVLDR
jgi:hypothetical protein